MVPYDLTLDYDKWTYRKHTGLTKDRTSKD